MKLDKSLIIEEIDSTELIAKEFSELIDEDTRGHFWGLWNGIRLDIDDNSNLKSSVEVAIFQTRACISSAKHFIPKKRVKEMTEVGKRLASYLEEISDNLDRLDFLKYCLYYKGKDEHSYPVASNEERYCWFEEMYVNMFPTKEKRKQWENLARENCLFDFPFLTDILVNTNVPLETKAIVAFAAVDYIYHTSGEGVEFLKDYGKGIIKPMDKYIYIDGNAYTPEEDYWRNGGNTGTLPQRITPSQVNTLKDNEVFVFGSNFHGHHLGGAAKAAQSKFGAIWGVGEGLQGKSYAIPTMEGIGNMIPAIERFTSFAKQHKELKFWVTPIGCGIAGYKAEDIALYFRDSAYLGNVYLPLSFWKIIRVNPTQEGETQKVISNLIDVCKYMHKHSFPQWDDNSDDNIFYSLERDLQWELGLQLGVISPNEEEPQIKRLPVDLENKIIGALREL